MKQLLIFDFDGVLCDSLQCVLKCTEKAALALEVDATISPEAVAKLDSVTFPEIGRIAGVPEQKLHAFVEIIFSNLQQSADSCSVFNGIPSALVNLAAAHTIAVVTANHPDVVRTVIGNAGALEAISSILGGDIPGNKAEKIAHLMRVFKMSAENCWI